VKATIAKVLALPEPERRAVLVDLAAQVEEGLGEIKNANVDDDGSQGNIHLIPDPNRKVRKPKSGAVPGLFPYVGGKQMSVEAIIEDIGPQIPGTVFVEPCAGSAVLSLNMLAKGYVEQVRLNDKSPGVVAYINGVLHNPQELQGRILSWEPTMRSLRKLWKGVKANSLTGIDLAFAHLVVQCVGHAGLGVMSGGRPTRITWKEWNPHRLAAKVALHHGLLKGRVVGDCCTNMDMLDLIAEPGERFLLVDPPYVKTGSTSYQHDLDEAGHRALAAALHGTGHRWLLAYDDAPLVRDLYAGFEVEAVQVQQTSRAAMAAQGCRRPELRIRSWRRLPELLEKAA